MSLGKSLAEVRAMDPKEWDAWRVFWRARPREDVLAAASLVCAGFERTMVGGEPDIGAYYPTVEPVRRRRLSTRRTVEALDRLFGV